MSAALFKPLARGYRWWISALLSCLPGRLQRYLADIGSQVELVIAHQGDSVFMQTLRGRIIDSVSCTHEAAIDLDKLPAEATDVTAGSYSNFFDAGQELLGKDPELEKRGGELDITLSGPGQEVDIDLLDLAVSIEAQDADDREIDLSGSSRTQNVIPLKIRREDVTGHIVDDENPTSRVLDLDPGSEDDTVIVQKDQGRLLQFGNTVARSPDQTALFANVGGKIRQLDADVSEAEIEALVSDGASVMLEADPGGCKHETLRIVAGLLDRYQRHRKCLYLIPENDLFMVKLSYPLEVMENLDGVLRLDLEKRIPVSVKSIRYFYALDVDAIENRVNVDIAVIKSDDFDLLNLVLGPYAERGLLCTTEKLYRKYGKRINFLETNSQPGLRSALRWRNLHLGFNFLLLGVLIAMPVYLLYQGNRDLGEVSDVEMQRVRQIVSAVNSLNEESRFNTQLDARIGHAPKTVRVLAVLSKNINDDAWIDKFSYRQGEISIRGEAVSATAVSDELSRTGLFEDIKFVSSIRKDPRTGKESFELEMRLKPDA